MASLRTRLIALLLVLSAAGLVLLGGVTYVEQRSFLNNRVDLQARAATGMAGHALDDQRPPGGAPGPRTPNAAPSGTYGQLRDANGHVTAAGFLFGYDAGSSTARPTLPTRLHAGQLLTVTSRGERYRVAVAADPRGGGVAVVAVPLHEVDQTLRRLLLVEALVIGGVLLVLGLASWAIVRVELRPLDRMGRTAGAIAAGALSRRVTDIDGRTEVGRLGRALNTMLDRLERAFAERQASEDRLRRFLADVSHELRTPLSSIRGYAELHRMGAMTDVDRSMERIEAEAARMGSLVEDLLTLARLDELSESPHEPVDLAALARDAADDGQAFAPSRRISLTVDGDPVVEGDVDRLRQVLANLVRNACIHTPDGTAIDIDVAATARGARVTVRDHGRGLPTDDGAALFERFWRAEGGRERGKAGAGLGLAIVAAIVSAHGGGVSAQNAPGGGASFTVELPAAGVRELVAS